jgi:hypothetical protein
MLSEELGLLETEKSFEPKNLYRIAIGLNQNFDGTDL